MCILIHHPVGSVLTDAHFEDFYISNPDGFGAIVNNAHGVQVIKHVGTLEEVQKLYRDHVMGYDAVIHMRWRTHGDINLDNCHPYEVVPGIWMSHNGVLSTGNAADATRSDTWHYIQNYLRPLLLENPSLIHVPAFQAYIGSHIGYSNKFGFMTEDGRSIIVNRSSGIEHDGVWFSNTYAWTPSKFGYKPTYQYGMSPHYATKTSYPTYSKESKQDEFSFASTKKKVGRPRKSAKKTPTKKSIANAVGKCSEEAYKRIIRSCWNQVELDGYHGALRWCSDNPMQAMHFIYKAFPSDQPQEVSDMVNETPDLAADQIMDIWDCFGEELAEVAGIEQSFTGVNYYDI
jgi:hypothetical protein